MREIFLELPIPPSLNSAYPTDKRTGRRYASPALKNFKKECSYIIKPEYRLNFAGSISITYIWHFKDKRRRDINNFTKAVDDILTYCKIYRDDCQIDMALNIRGEINKEDPYVEVAVREETASNIIQFPIR
jgi:crossover junction endodeoxyribonuclease RusA